MNTVSLLINGSGRRLFKLPRIRTLPTYHHYQSRHISTANLKTSHNTMESPTASLCNLRAIRYPESTAPMPTSLKDTHESNLPANDSDQLLQNMHVLSDDPTVHNVFDKATGSWQYVVADPATSTAAIIDPVLGFDPVSGRISTTPADALLDIVHERGYQVKMILETHAHADHITAASYLQQRLGQELGHKPLICIGSRIKQVQKMFGEKYSIPAKDYEGSFDKLWEDDERFKIGNLTAQAMHLPGHTPDHVGYKIGGECANNKHIADRWLIRWEPGNVFVGDSVFNADLGSARADFPGGSAEAIFHSGRKLFALSDDTKLWTGHDYPPEGRNKPVPYMTVKQQKETNKHLKEGTAKAEFVEMRQARDESLAMPRLLHASLQMNIRAGRLPRPTASGERVLRDQTPVKVDTPW